MKLITDRLSIRLLDWDDIKELAPLYDADFKNSGFLFQFSLDSGEEIDFQSYLAAKMTAIEDSKNSYWVIRQDNNFVGTLSCEYNESGNIYLGLQIFTPYRNQGLAYEALFGIMTLYKYNSIEKSIYATVHSSNLIAEQLLHKLAFNKVFSKDNMNTLVYSFL